MPRFSGRGRCARTVIVRPALMCLVVTLVVGDAAPGGSASPTHYRAPDPVVLGLGSGPMSVAFNSTGTLVAAADQFDSLWTWSVASGRRLAYRNDAGATAVAFRPSSDEMAVGEVSGTIVSATSASGALEPTLNMPNNLDSSEDQVGGVAYTPDSQYLVAGDDLGSLVTWETSAIGTAHLVMHQILPPLASDGGIEQIAVDDSGSELMARGGNGSVLLAAIPSGPAFFLKASGSVFAALSPDGTTVATVGHGGDLSFWSTATHKETGRLDGKGISSIAYSPDGSLLAVTTRKESVRLFATGSLRPIGEPVRVGNGLDGLVFSPSGNALAALSHSLVLWRIDQRTLEGCRVRVCLRP
jgi:WD40 repeat protein